LFICLFVSQLATLCKNFQFQTDLHEIFREGWQWASDHHTSTVSRPFSGTTRVSQCQKRTSGLYGARED